MKILIDARLYGLENAGLGRYTINLVRELTELDHKNGYTILLRKKYFDLLKFPKNWNKVLTDIPHYSFGEQTTLPKIINDVNPDLIHFLHFNVPLVLNRKYIVTIHDLLMHKNKGLGATTLVPPLYYLKRLGYKTIFRKAVTGSKKIIVPSFAVKNEVVDYYKIPESKVSVIYEGFDEHIGRARVKDYGDYFVYAGNAYPHKNLARLVTAISELNSEGTGIQLLIASSRNVFTDRIQKIVKRLNAEDFVKILGFVPDEKLGGLLKNSVAFVFPSISEGFGLPGLEAINSGTLLLASDIPVFREIYEGNAVYFDPFEVSSIKSAMLSAISMSGTERERRINVAKNFAKRYSWAKMAKETLALYEKEGRNSLRSG